MQIDVAVKTLNTNPKNLVIAREESKNIRIIRIHPLRTMITCHDRSVWAKMADPLQVGHTKHGADWAEAVGDNDQFGYCGSLLLHVKMKIGVEYSERRIQ